MIRWPLALDAHIREITGPEDEFNDGTNGDPDSLVGEEDERGFDDMSLAVGWDDGDFEADEDDEEGEDEE